MFKSNKGFTLVELIVVIAILAILAGVAIPVYNGYIKRAQDAAVVTELDAIQTAAQAANATAGQIEMIVVKSGSIEVAGPGNKLAKGFNSDFVLFFPDATASANLGEFSFDIDLGNATYKNGATWKDGDWSAYNNENIGDQTEAAIGGGSYTPPAEEEEEEEEEEKPAAHDCVWSTTGTVTPPTCGDQGYTTYSCTVSGCTKTMVSDYTDATGACTEWDTDGYCVVCGTHKSEVNNTSK